MTGVVMRRWDEECETLLGAVALYAQVMWGDNGEYVVRIEDPEDDKYLRWLLESLSRYRATESSVPGGRRYHGDAEAEEAYELLDALCIAAEANDNEACKDILGRLRARFPMADHPLPLWVLDVVMNLHGVVVGGTLG
jgi:hypothetical protein